MRQLTEALLGCLGGAAIALASAQAAVVIPVTPVNGSSVTTVFAINDNNTIAGSFIGSGDGIEHGFFGALNGAYTTFDVGSGGSEARGINNRGFITGISNSQNGSTANEPIFERLPAGTILNVTMSGQQLFGLAQGINNNNKFAGYYWNTRISATEGFLGRKGKWHADIEVPTENQFAGGIGINDANTIVGYFFAPPLHGFVLSGKTLTVVDYPGSGSTGTVLNGINNNGQVVGQWIDKNGRQHSFLFDIASSAFTDIKVKGASVVRAWGINSAGAVAVSTDIGSFIWCKKAKQCPTGGGEVETPIHAVAQGFSHLSVQ